MTRFRQLTATTRRTLLAALIASLAGLVTAGIAVAATLTPSAGRAATLAFPAPSGTYNAASWAAGCSPACICGTASDPNGVSSVGIGIFQKQSRRYWNGSAFTSSVVLYNTASGTSTWNYPFTPPADGPYTIYIRIINGLGNPRPATTIPFTYDTTPPGTPLLLAQPANPTTSSTAQFNFIVAGWPNITFYCALDAGTAVPCSGGNAQQYTGLAVGNHCFYVYATDAAGNQGPTTSYCWTITALSLSPFTVGGDLATPLYPGTSESLDLTFINPNASTVTLAPGAVTSANITITTSRPVTCPASNFAVTQGLTATVVIPANQLSEISLSDLSVPQADWPVISMLETNTNQDACQGALLTLTYSGIGGS